MRSFRRIAIAAVLAIGQVAAAGVAWANTELHPASRLVAPYWDVNPPRATILFLTNASRRVNLVRSSDVGNISGPCNTGTAGPLGAIAAPPTGVAGTNCGVHLEFYDKTCVNIDVPMDLSRLDLDQLDLAVDGDLGGVRGLPSKLGWVDIDVRRAMAGSGHNATGVQANVLIGTALITDGGSNFAVAYPMAPSIGLSTSPAANPASHDIVTRDPSGNALVWTGGYENFPARLFVPMFFAEGINHGPTFSSTLVIAAPAQASLALGLGEAPGQTLLDNPLTLFDESVLIHAPGVDIMDACENPVSDRLTGHYIIGSLDALFTQQVTDSPVPYGNACPNYPAGDVDRVAGSNAFHGGWIDIPNTARGTLWPASAAVPPPAGPIFGTERGMVGVLIQNTTSGTGDATRLWGDCAYGTDGVGGVAATGCRDASYSLLGITSHLDLRP